MMMPAAIIFTPMPYFSFIDFSSPPCAHATPPPFHYYAVCFDISPLRRRFFLQWRLHTFCLITPLSYDLMPLFATLPFRFFIDALIFQPFSPLPPIRFYFLPDYCLPVYYAEMLSLFSDAF